MPVEIFGIFFQLWINCNIYVTFQEYNQSIYIISVNSYSIQQQRPNQYQMWAAPTLDDLHSLLQKSKTYKSKPKDLDTLTQTFDRYFNHFRIVTNPSKVIQIYIQIFINNLHLFPHQKLSQCFKKLIYWLNSDPKCQSAYLIVKNVVEVCEREFKGIQWDKNGEEEKGFKKEEGDQRERGLSQGRDKNIERDSMQREEPNKQTLKANLKTVLNLVRKSGDKNMLIQDPYKAFIDYYLQRINISLQQAHSKSTQPTLVPTQPTLVPTPILSQLSTLLSNRNKPQVLPYLTSHIQQAQPKNNSSLIPIYILNQFRNIPSLLGPVLKNKDKGQFVYNYRFCQAWQGYVEEGDVREHVHGLGELFFGVLVEVMRMIGFCLRQQYFDVIPQIYKLFPQPVSNSQQMLDRILIHLTLHHPHIPTPIVPKPKQQKKWRQSYLQYHQQIIQSTSLQSYKLKYLNQHKNASNILNFGYVLKLYLFAHFLILPHQEEGEGDGEDRGSVGGDMEFLFDVLRKEFRNAGGEAVVSEYRKLGQDCIRAFSSVQFGSTNKNNTHKFNKKCKDLGADLDKIQKFKSLILQLGDRISNHQTKQQTFAKMKQLITTNPKQHFVPAWKYLIQSLFQLSATKNKQQNDPTQDDQLVEQFYNKQSQICLKLMSIQPSEMPKKNASRDQIAHKLSGLEQACVECLSEIAKVVDKQQLVNYIKRLMSENYDRVDQQIIRDIISRNVFLCKCLLMTNHIHKSKVLLQFMLRFYQFPQGSQQSPHFLQYLSNIFPLVPTNLLLDYCRYLSTRDKLLFRMRLYEKKMLSYDRLIEASVYQQVVCCVDHQKMIDQNL